jgi:hypothetical protein
VSLTRSFPTFLCWFLLFKLLSQYNIDVIPGIGCKEATYSRPIMEKKGFSSENNLSEIMKLMKEHKNFHSFFHDSLVLEDFLPVRHSQKSAQAENICELISRDPKMNYSIYHSQGLDLQKRFHIEGTSNSPSSTTYLRDLSLIICLHMRNPLSILAFLQFLSQSEVVSRPSFPFISRNNFLDLFCDFEYVLLL